MTKKEQEQFNETVRLALEDIMAAVHTLAQGRAVTDDHLKPIYKSLARLGGLMQP